LYSWEENVKKNLPLVKKILPIIVVVVLLQVISIPESQAAPPARGGGIYHTVQYGETLFSIGRRYGVNPYHIAQVNGLDDPDYIYAGQVLYIPSGSGYGRYPKQGGYYYQYPTYGHGYDYTGYYYFNNYPNYRRYSYTCGYYYNCY
jgi:hypothetical protein